MANNILTTNFNYTYDGLLSTQIFIDPAVKNPDFSALFRVRSGIRDKEQLNIAAQLGKVLKGYQGCTNTVTGQGVQITNRTLTVCPIEFYLEQCEDVFESTILGELAKTNYDRYNLTGTQLGSLVNNLVAQTVQRDLFRIFSFGDTSSGPNDYYNPCDGLWTKLFDGAASYEVTAVNDSITTLSASDAQSYFQALWTGAPIELKQLLPNEKDFFVTGNVYEALMAYYETNANGGGFTQREEMGVMNLYYRGTKVTPFYAWDNWIDLDNLGNNVRILYTTRDNHVVGVEDASMANMWNFWFDPNTNLNKIRGSFKMGYNYVHSKLSAISYGNV